MFNPQTVLIDHFVQELKDAYHQTYSFLNPEYEEVIAWTGRLALENIANSDALYHDIEHTTMVTLVGQAILKGKHLQEGGIRPRDWLHFTIALLCHDIGYVRGICRADRPEEGIFATGVNGETVQLPVCGTDAIMKDYHVDRAQLFVEERFGHDLLFDVDVELVNSYIEMTRFPPPEDDFHLNATGYHGLIRAADFIGQLGDPKYIRKIPALYYEFEEVGANEANGYTCPEDMRRDYAGFYWKVVHPLIQEALRFLRVTQEGKYWIANLHAHVFDSEHPDALL
jgi:hypothetical protein